MYSVGPKRYIKDGDERLCRFCQKDKNKTSFKTDAHAIPECLGNRQLILLDECDTCNTYFSEELEDHLDKFSKPFRICILGFGNLILQFIVPSSVDDGKEMKLKIPFFPSPFESGEFIKWNFGEIKHHLIDMSGTKKVKRDCPLIYSFNEMKEVDFSDLDNC